MPAAIDSQDEAGQSREKAHCVFTPLHYERNDAYPLVVWLHGADDDDAPGYANHAVGESYLCGCGCGARLPCGSELVHLAARSGPYCRAHERVCSAISAALCWLNIAPRALPGRLWSGRHDGSAVPVLARPSAFLV